MDIESREIEGVTILLPRGRMTIKGGDTIFRAGLTEALNQGATKIIINFESLTFIDSSGVGELVSTYTKTSNKGIGLKLCNLPEQLLTVLETTQLITIFDVYKSEADALQAFSPTP